MSELKFLNAHYIPYSESNWLDYKDVDFIPSFSLIKSEKDVDTKAALSETVGLLFPIIINVTPKDDVNFIIQNIKNGFYSFINSEDYDDINKLKEDIKKVYTETKTVGFNVGLSMDDENIVNIAIEAILELHPDKKVPSKPIVFVKTDVADNELAISQIRHLKLKYGTDITIAAGYFKTPVGISKAIDNGASIIFVAGTLTDHLKACNTLFTKQSNARLVFSCWDFNIVKALAAGADIVSITRNPTRNLDSLKDGLMLSMKTLGCRTIKDLYNKTKFRVKKHGSFI